MNYKLLFGIVAILFSLGVSGLLLYDAFYLVEQVEVIDADLKVTDNKFGFNLDKDMLHFGKVKRGAASSLRTIIINNTRTFPVEIQIKATGDLKPFLIAYVDSPERTGRFNLGPHQEAAFKLEMHVPQDTPLGYYKGKIKVITRKMR